MKFFPASIQRYLIATMACICVPGIGALGYMAIQSGIEVAANKRLADLVEADRALLVAGNTIRNARGQAQTVILTTDDATSAIRKIDEANKAALAQAIERLVATGLAEREALADEMRRQDLGTRDKLAQVYAEAAKPKDARSLAATAPWYDAVGAMVENAMLKASGATSTAVRMADPNLADLQAFKASGWDVRANYGTQCSLLRPLVASGKAIEPAQLRALGEYRGVSNNALKELAQLGARAGVGSELTRKIGVMTSEVAAANAQLDALVGKLGAAAGPLMPAAEFTKLCNGPFQAIVNGVTQSLDDMVAITQEKLTAAWLRLAVVSTLLLAVLGVCIAALRGIRRRVGLPLAGLKSSLDTMQQGDFSQPIPAAPSPDEIGALTAALETYRENALALEKNRRDRELAMLADAEQAQKVQALLSEVSAIVVSARDGDFSGRAQTNGMQGPLKELVEGINEINGVVDSATTEFAGTLQAIAGGDLTNRVDTAYRGRFADLKHAINETIDRLSDTVTTIQTTAADVQLASREINMGADDLSKRTEDQASSLEETAATTEQLAASVKASASGSRDAARIAAEAMQAAQSGGAIAGQAVEAMARIESASQKISDIIRVIDDIAFQTNLLALNAAVEAARAGEAGKGFAVVASEVRTLAQRSSDAAKDISSLISSSNSEVEGGVKLVRQAGEQLSHILKASQKVAATIADISAASGEQSSGIDEMAQAVAHLDEMTQQNAALAEESAASANALSDRIGQLNDLVAQFKTGREGQAMQAHAYAAPMAQAAAGGSARAATRPAPARHALAPRPAPRPVAATAGHVAAGDSEPERLRQLAEAAFAQTKAAPAPRKAAASRQDDGWEEF